MAHLLQIVVGSNTPIDLEADPNGILLYVPTEIQENQLLITESVKILFTSSTIPLLQAMKQSVTLAFNQARRRKKKKGGPRVWLYWQLDSTTGVYRAEITNGYISLPDDMLDGGFVSIMYECVISWTRTVFDRQDLVISLPLYNRAYPTPLTTGVTIFNPVVRYTDTDIYFTSGTKRIGLVAGSGLEVFHVGDTIYIKGSASNNSTFTVTAVNISPNYLTVAEAVVTEAASATVIILGPAANYVEIDGDSILGDTPAPIILEIQFDASFGSSPYGGKIWVSHNVDASPETLSLLLDSSAVTAGGTPTSSATATNGSYAACAWSGTTETTLLTWTLTGAALLELALGNFFAFLIRLYSDPTAGIKLRLQLQDSVTSTVLWLGEQVTVGSYQLIELGSSRLPPGLIDGLANGDTASVFAQHIGDLNLILTAQQPAGGSSTLNIDYIQLLAMDGLRTLTPAAGSHALTNYTLIDDEITPQAPYMRTDTSSPIIYASYQRYTSAGNPIMLIPGITQRLYFNFLDLNGDALITYYLAGVLVFYRPNRQTI